MGVYKLMAYSIKEISDHLRMQEMCIAAAEINRWQQQ